MVEVRQWQEKIGQSRDWFWRGWRVSYSFDRPDNYQDKRCPPLLLIHGFGAAIGHWRNNIPSLAKNRPVYAIDLLGFGASQKVFTSYQVSLWQAQVYDFWRTFINCPVVLVGNSLGSLVSLSVAARHPEVVGRLIMLNIPDVGDRSKQIPPLLFPLLRSLENLVANSFLLRPLFYFLRSPKIIQRLTSLAYSNPNKVTDELIEIFSTPPQDQDADLAFLALVRSARTSDFSPSIKELLSYVTSPILLIWGKEDRIIPFRLASRIAKLAPQIEFVPLDRIGHCPQDECPELINHLILQWLEPQE